MSVSGGTGAASGWKQAASSGLVAQNIAARIAALNHLDAPTPK